MKTKKTTTLIIIIAVTAVFTLIGLTEKADACRSCSSGGSKAVIIPTPTPHFYQPIMPPELPVTSLPLAVECDAFVS